MLQKAKKTAIQLQEKKLNITSSSNNDYPKTPEAGYASTFFGEDGILYKILENGVISPIECCNQAKISLVNEYDKIITFNSVGDIDNGKLITNNLVKLQPLIVTNKYGYNSTIGQILNSSMGASSHDATIELIVDGIVRHTSTSPYTNINVTVGQPAGCNLNQTITSFTLKYRRLNQDGTPGATVTEATETIICGNSSSHIWGFSYTIQGPIYDAWVEGDVCSNYAKDYTINGVPQYPANSPIPSSCVRDDEHDGFFVRVNYIVHNDTSEKPDEYDNLLLPYGIGIFEVDASANETLITGATGWFSNYAGNIYTKRNIKIKTGYNYIGKIFAIYQAEPLTLKNIEFSIKAW